jgi:microcystin-dependent protein
MMADGTTTNFGWVLPEVHLSPTTWGDKLNADLQAIDAKVYANQQAIAVGSTVIGEIKMFGGATAPTGWLICDGSSISRAAPYDQLFAVLGTTYGFVDSTHFNLPDLRGRSPVGVGTLFGTAYLRGAAGGEDKHVLLTAELASHSHTATEAAHQHVINLTQSVHNHGDPGHAHADAGHTHSVANQTTLPNIVGGAGGVTVAYINAGNTGVGFANIQAAGTGIQAANANVAISAQDGAGGPRTNLASASITVGSVGSGTGHNTYHPYLAVTFLIRYQ